MTKRISFLHFSATGSAAILGPHAVSHAMTRHPQRILWSQATPIVRQAAASTAPPGNVIPRSWFRDRIRDFDLWLVCEGRVRLIPADGPVSLLTRGSTVWLRPGLDFELRVDSSGPYSNAYIHFDFLDAKGSLIPPEHIEIPPPVGMIEDTLYFESTMRRVMYLQYQLSQGGRSAHHFLQNQASRLLTGLLHDYVLGQRTGESSIRGGIEQHHARIVSAALSWLYLHPESKNSAADLAEKFGYSQRHFCRIFRQTTGKSPGQALIAARIDHAKKLLISSALNVSKIAESLGYENVFYFSRQFKSVVGVSPAKFREPGAP